MAKCTIEGCDKVDIARGWCPKHYTKWQRHGNPLYKKPLKKFEKCIVTECERMQKSKGYCNTHATKLRRTGTLEKINFTEAWKERNVAARHSELVKLDSTRNSKGRGYLAPRVVSDLQNKAKTRGIDWELTQVEAYNLIISECLYCGFKPNWPIGRVGIDRVDNSVGYKKDNVVSCCFTCNSAKGNKTLDEFIDWVKKIHSRIVS